jgi:hypothetical protein
MIRDGLLRIAPLAKALAMCAVVSAAVLPGCTVTDGDDDDDGGEGGESGSPDGNGGSAGSYAGNAGKGGWAGKAGSGGYAGEAAGEGGTAGDSEPAEGGAGGDPVPAEGGSGGEAPEIEPPDAIEYGDVQVSCTVNCEEDSCAGGSVFVSACSKEQPGLCYEITPIDDPSGDGNTYVIAIDGDGRQDVLEGTQCTATSDDEETPPVDLLFAIDTTTSMDGAIAGVVASIDAFVDDLAKSGVNIRIGGIAFGDRAPLSTCVSPDAPLAPLTDKFGEDAEDDEESFDVWLSNLSSGHCGDGGGDLPENALDAIEFAIGNDPDSSDAFSANKFDWGWNSVRMIVVITDNSQHQESDGSGFAHFDLDEVKSDLEGFAVVHAIGPNTGCYNTPAAGCACNETPGVCDDDCPCDLKCSTPSCGADDTVGTCDDSDATCDRDCAGFPSDVACDENAGFCDPDPDDADEPCAEDIDCAGAQVGDTSNRRCDPTDVSPFADIGELALATGGSFTNFPTTGEVDLTRLPLTGVIVHTERCDAKLPENAESVRCVYSDADGHKGEVTVELY